MDCTVLAEAGKAIPHLSPSKGCGLRFPQSWMALQDAHFQPGCVDTRQESHQDRNEDKPDFSTLWPQSTRHTTSEGQQAAAKLDALLNAAATVSEYDDAIILNGPQYAASSRHLHERDAPGYSHSTFPPSLPASLVSSCRAAPPQHLYTSEATSTDRSTHTASANSVSFSSSLSLYQSIPEYFRQHMDPPQEPHQPPTAPSTLDTAPLSTAGIPGTHRTLRLSSRGKPESANSLLNEFATEELRTLSQLLPASAAVAVADRQPGEECRASPASPPSASTVGSQPTGSEHLSPESAPRTLGRAGSKRPSMHEDMLSEDALNDDDVGLDWNDNSKHVSSTFRGVYKRKFDTKWRAEITAGRRKRCLGSFSSEKEAAEAYDKAALTLRGPAAFTNFPANHYASVSTRNEPVKGRAGLGVKDRRFMGVAWCPPSQQFEARIWTRNGEEHQLVGMFDTADAAARAYDQAALKMHGTEAYTNFLLKPEAGSQRGAGSGSRHAPTGGVRGHGGGEGGVVNVTVKASALGKAPTGKGSSKFRGVSWHKDNMKWRATIFKGSKPVHIGYFDSQQGAARAYDQEAIRLRGPNTSLNFPITDYDVGAPDEEEQDGFSSPLSPSPSPRRLMPERSFVDESGRVLGGGGGGSPPLATLGPRLDARLVAVFSPRSLAGQAAPADSHTQPESLDHESRAGSESGPRYWAHPPEEAPGPSGAGQPHPSPGTSGDYPLAPPTAPSLQALMKTNPGILKTIQVNEPQQGAVSKRGRPLSKPVQGRHGEGASRGRPPLSRQASRLHSASAHRRHSSPTVDTPPSTAASQLDDGSADVGDNNSSGGFDLRREEPVDLLAAAAATLAGCKKDKQGMLPMWGHKGRRSQGHDASTCSHEADLEPARSGEDHMGGTWVQQPAVVSGRTLRPRAAKKLRSS